MQIELQDIMRRFGDDFRASGNMSHVQHKAMNAIQTCRTAKLGGHLDRCDDCGTTKISHNSCRNRNCPKCGNLKKEQWILDRKANLLPISHFHAVFTVPDTLHELFLHNQEKMYSHLFRAVSQTLRALALDKRHLGAEIGFTAVLHTWGQTLSYHPHIHCIIPGGGLRANGMAFVNSRKKFFLPVKALSVLFRGKLLDFIKRDLLSGAIKLPGKQGACWNSDHREWFDQLHRKNWVVYCKKPFRNPDTVIEYLSRYTHKTAIYNNRLVQMNDTSVTFKWKDYRDGNRPKNMTLDAGEFVRRFLLHVLPSGFQRIRHYGILSNRNQRYKLLRCFRILKVQKPEKKKLTVQEMVFLKKGVDIMRCPDCGGHWVRIRSFFPMTC